MVPVIMENFTIHGPNGEHECYVAAPARASLAGVKDGSWVRLFKLDTARVLDAQLVIAVEYIHARGYVHGDLHLGNVLLKMPSEFHQLPPEKLYERYGAPELDPVVRFDGEPLPPGVPSHGVAPIWLGEASEDISAVEAQILLSDFGQAFPPSREVRYESHTPLAIRPPEIIFEYGKPLSFPFLATQDDMVCEHVDALGILPPEWWQKWEARHSSFAEDGTPINRSAFRSWDDRFEDSIQQPRCDSGMPPFGSDERDAISSMLRLMLSFKPENRPTAKQVLESEWMVKWALHQCDSYRDQYPFAK
ncbi:hypothetical protein MauCBS54593_002154 [Microsporum audouinii]